MEAKLGKVRNAMLAVQRYPWEQGVLAQALYEMSDYDTMIAAAHDAVLRQQPDGRLAVINDNIAVTDPAVNGEAVYRAYELTGDSFYRDAADRQLSYLRDVAPKTEDGILFHNEISFHEGFSPNQFWADSLYMAPPFLAVMGYVEEAAAMIKGYLRYLQDKQTGLLYHIYDYDQKRFVRKKLWATGNGWALLGIGRLIDSADCFDKKEIKSEMTKIGATLLQSMLVFQCKDGRFHDILDDSESFVDGTSAMMLASYIYRGVTGGWLSASYLKAAEQIAETMEQYVDEYGIIHEVCGCPDFLTEGTSAESMAAYLMMHAWRQRASHANIR